MKFNYTKQFNDNASITVKVGISGLTFEEQEALETVGAAQIDFSEYYPLSKTKVEHYNIYLTNFVDISTVFNSRTYDILSISAEVDRYIADIKEYLRKLVEDMMTRYRKYLAGETDPEKPEDDDHKCLCGCNSCNGLNIRLVETIPDDLKDGEVFGIILDDEEEDD